MALGSRRKHWRMEALTTAATLIEMHVGMADDTLELTEEDREIFEQECKRLAKRLDKQADKLGYEGHVDCQKIKNIY